MQEPVYYQDEVGLWRWKVKAANGKVIDASSESFSSKASHINQANPNPGIQVGSARLHLSSDGCNHRDSNVCPACADLTDAEVAALREYFARLLRQRTTIR